MMESSQQPAIEGMVQHGPQLPINPFVHHLEIGNACEKLKVLVLTVTVLPFRAVGILVCLVLAWILACVGLAGFHSEDSPMKGWRRQLRTFVCMLVRLLFAFGGFHWITVKGKQASPKEAPVLALAPHSTYFDALPVVFLGAPSIVAKGETQNIPFFGKLITYTEPLYVWREDPDSRGKTIREMVRRATDSEDWPQVLIFPEGTCTNRSCLITFKPGAFIPGVPVQPVCIRYPNNSDTVTWTWEGPSFLKTMWLTLTQLHNSCEIEFLPVYVPTAAEKENAKLYAKNVQILMARALGVPLTEYMYEDCRILLKAACLGFHSDMEEIQALRNQLRLHENENEQQLVINWIHGDLQTVYVCDYELSAMLDISPKTYEFQRLCKLLSDGKDGRVDISLYVLLAAWFGVRPLCQGALLKLFKILDPEKKDYWTLSNVMEMLSHIKELKQEDVYAIFTQMDSESKGTIVFDDFEKLVSIKPEYLKLFSNCLKPLSTSMAAFALHSNNSQVKLE